MRNIALKITAVVFCIAFLLALPLGATGVKPSRLSDGADLLTSEQKVKLHSKLDSLSEKYGQDIVIITLEDYSSNSVQIAADNLFKGGYGETGILLLVSMETREYAISANGEAAKIFTENDMTSLENAFVGYLSDGYYYNAFNAFADKCAYIIKYDNRLSPIWIFFAVLVGIAVASLVVWKMCSKHKSVKMQSAANAYMRRDTFRLDHSRDVYLYSHVTRVRRPKNTSSGGSRSGSGSSGTRGRSGRF